MEKSRNGVTVASNDPGGDKHVFVVHHVASADRDDSGADIKLIGVFSTRSLANDAVLQLSTLQGFRQFPTSFHIDQYVLDAKYWTEGFGVGVE